MTAKILPAKDRSISAAQFCGAGKEAEYRIEGNPGLVLVVLPPGSEGRCRRVWRCYYSRTIGGRRQRREVRLGAYPAMGLADARALAAKIMAEVDRGQDPFMDRLDAVKHAEQSTLTLADLVADYLTDRRDLASVAETERELQKDVLPLIGSKRPSEITPGDIDQLATMVLDRGSPAMARRLITHLKAIYNYSLFDAPRLAEKYSLVLNPAGAFGATPAHADLGFVLIRRGQHEAAVAEFERSMALNPNFTDWRFADVLVYAGHSARAIEVVERHMRLDPFYVPSAPGFLGFAHYMLKQYSQALPLLRECVSRAPNLRGGHVWLAASYAQLGNIEDARGRSKRGPEDRAEMDHKGHASAIQYLQAR